MKIWKFFLMSLAFAVATIGFTACGGDDDNGGGDPKIVGKWVDLEYGDYYQFNGNGTGVCVFEDERADFTYTFDGTRNITLSWVDFDDEDKGYDNREYLTYHEGTRPYISDESGYRYYKE